MNQATPEGANDSFYHAFEFGQNTDVWRVNKVYATYKNLYDSSVAIVFLLFTWNQRHYSFVVLLVWDDILNTAISVVLNSDPL